MEKKKKRISSLQEYEKLIFPGSDKDSEKDCIKNSCKVLDIILSERRAEIDLFWRRSTYYWAFILAIYTGYFKMLTENCFRYSSFFLCVLSVLGVFFCFGFCLQCLGSKFWQENWEKHLSLYEKIYGIELFDVVFMKNKYAFSVSKINILLSGSLAVTSVLLAIYSFFPDLLKVLCNLHLSYTVGMVVFVFAFIILILFIGSKLRSSCFYKEKNEEDLDVIVTNRL